MNAEQTKAIARHIVTVFGGFLVGWAASRGKQWGDLVNNLISSDFFIGLVAAGLSSFWAFLATKTPNLVSTVNNLSGVKAVITANNDEGLKLASAVPAPTVVPAGTPEASNLAKS